MLSGQILPGWLIIALVFMFFTGLICLTWGRRLPRNGDWLVGIGAIGLLTVAALASSSYFEDPSAPKTWIRNWIPPRGELGAVNVGILHDSLGLAIMALASGLAAISLTARRLLGNEVRPERLFAAAAFSTTGVVLSWVSVTPWLAFTGIAMSVFGGFIAMGTEWEHEPEAAIAARFARERIWGLALTLFGASILASNGAALNWAEQQAWAQDSANTFGAITLAIGLFVQLQPFPFLGWNVMASRSNPTGRIIYAQIYTALAAFAIFTRFDAQFRAVGVFPVLGWAALASSALTVLSGMLQTQWKMSLGMWISSAFALATAVLAFSGPWAAASLFIGTSLAGVAISLFGATLEGTGEAPRGSNQRATAAKFGAILAAAAGTGMVGFVVCGGSIRWLAGALDNPTLITASAFVLFIGALLAWKTVWMLVKEHPSTEAGWAAVLTPYLVTILSLGVIWNGTLTGGALPDTQDQVSTSALSAFFGQPAGTLNQDTFFSASWIHWGAFLLAIITAYWTTARKQNSWAALHGAAPKVSHFFASGYGIDRLTGRILFGLSWLGSAIQSAVETKTWGQWLPQGISWVIHRIARGTSVADTVLTRQLDLALRRGTEVPAKMLQMIQSGDVQWYLFFAVGSGIAILVHFLKF